MAGARRHASMRGPAHVAYDPGRELRAEHRARELLRSCIEPEDWAMYRDLGFLRVWGQLGDRPGGAAAYAYLIYPHRPIVAFVPHTGALLNEYCVAFPDHSKPYGSTRLPDSDDVLAKWMALSADERHLIAEANMHLPGRQIDPERVSRDLVRLAGWEREHAGELRRQAQEPGPDRRSGACRRARLPARDRLLRRGPLEADRRRRPLVDRDDAVQLQQPRP